MWPWISPVDWMIWGLRSLPGPIINLAQVLVIALVLVVVARVIGRLWPAADRAASRIGTAFGHVRRRIGFDDPETFGQIIFVLAVAYLGIVCLVHVRLIGALVNPISALTPEQRALLSPDNLDQHTAYRSALDFLVVGLGLSLYRLIGMRGPSHARQPRVRGSGRCRAHPGNRHVGRCRTESCFSRIGRASSSRASDVTTSGATSSTPWFIAEVNLRRYAAFR